MLLCMYLPTSGHWNFAFTVVHRQQSTEYLVPGTRLTVTRAIDDIRLGNIY